MPRRVPHAPPRRAAWWPDLRCPTQHDPPFEEQTVDHLFGEVWAGTDLSVRDRRLVLIGLAVGSGQTDVAGLQADSALRLGELDAADLRYLVTFLAHYAGWPRGAAFNSEVETIIARHEKAAAASDDDLP